MNASENILSIMKNKRKLFIALIVLLVLLLFSSLLFKHSSKTSVVPTISPTIVPTEEGIQEIHFTEEQLKSYYSSYKNPFVLHIRKALDNYLAGTNESINLLAIKVDKAEDGTIGGLDSFSKDYYKSKFIVFAINNNDFGGKTINIVFQDKPDKLFNAWIYQITDGYYELRGFWQNKTFTEKEMINIQKEYKIYLNDKQHAL